MRAGKAASLKTASSRRIPPGDAAFFLKDLVAGESDRNRPEGEAVMRCSIRIGLAAGLAVTLGLATRAGAGELPKQLVMAVTPSNIPTELFKASEVFAAKLKEKIGFLSKRCLGI